jgi:hypothetical protein
LWRQARRMIWLSRAGVGLGSYGWWGIRNDKIE